MTPTLMSCADAVVTPAARTIAASVVVLANCFISVLRQGNGAERRSCNYSMFRSYRTTCGVASLRFASAVFPQPTRSDGPASFRLEARDDLARNRLDLLSLVFVGNEDDFLRSDRHVRFELLDAFVDRSHDGALLGRFTPGGKVPLLGEPFHHWTLDGLPRLADEDRQLRGVEEFVGVFSRLIGKATDLIPCLGEAFGQIEIGQPSIAHHR